MKKSQLALVIILIVALAIGLVSFLSLTTADQREEQTAAAVAEPLPEPENPVDDTAAEDQTTSVEVSKPAPQPSVKPAIKPDAKVIAGSTTLQKQSQTSNSVQKNGGNITLNTAVNVAKLAQITKASVDKITKQKKTEFKNYSASVQASKELKIPGPPGELRVWIGETSHMPELQSEMVAEITALGATGETAKVTPFTLGIDVEPKVSKCKKIIASGAQVRFKLIPIEAGTFTVGADVELYDSNDCSGPPVPKSAKSVKVEVAVEIVGLIAEGGQELAGSAWQAFVDFWDKLLILIFALLLFLIRKKLRKWFGFKDGAD